MAARDNVGGRGKLIRGQGEKRLHISGGEESPSSDGITEGKNDDGTGENRDYSEGRGKLQNGRAGPRTMFRGSEKNPELCLLNAHKKPQEKKIKKYREDR